MVLKSWSVPFPGVGRWRRCRMQSSLATVLLLAVLVVRRIILSEGESGAILAENDVDLRPGQRVVGGAVIGQRGVGDPNKARELLFALWPSDGGADPPLQARTPGAPGASVEWSNPRPPRPPKAPPPPPPPPDLEEEEYEQLPVPPRMEWPRSMVQEAATARLVSWRLARGVDSEGRALRMAGQPRMEMGEEWKQLVERAQRNGTRMWERVGGEEEAVLPGPLPVCDLLVGIHSSPLHVSRRQACRDTWLNAPEVKEGRVVYRFFVGLHRNVSVSEALLEERRAFGDIVVLPLMDSYYVIAFKTLAIAAYGATRLAACFVMKTDDDAYVRLDSVLSNLTALPPSEGLLYGSLVHKTAPSRARRSKWFVSYKEWPQRHFPTFPHGAAYVFSAHIARSISAAHASGNLTMFKLEDVGLAIWVDALAQGGMAVEYVHDPSIVFDGCRAEFSVAHYQTPTNMHCLHTHLASGRGAKCCDQ